jgi:hypothetical protein
LTDYFDQEVGWARTPSIGFQRAGDLGKWVPKRPDSGPGQIEPHKPRWVPGVPGYDPKKDRHTDEYKEHHKKHHAPHKKAKKAPNKKHKRTEQERAEHLANMKAWSEKVQTEHQNAMRIFLSENAFQDGSKAPILIALEYINRKLSEFTDLRKKAVDNEKAKGYDKKTTRESISTALANERTPTVNAERLGNALNAIKIYFDSKPVFDDHYKVHETPTHGMTFLSTAILYFKTVKHQIMKAAVHKARHLPTKTGQVEEFLRHNDHAEDLLHKMHKGWKAHLLKDGPPNAAEHNAYLKHVMHSKFHEWQKGHPDEKVPPYARRFEPGYVHHRG